MINLSWPLGCVSYAAMKFRGPLHGEFLPNILVESVSSLYS
jgi:hypothetical protein